jgi:hypothetical protein
MVTTKLDFVHFRSVAQLAGHVKWLARGLYWFGNKDKEVHTFAKKETKKEEKGDIDDVEKETLKLDKIAENEEDTLFHIIKCELILFNEMEKEEYKEEKTFDSMKSFLAKLSDKDRKDFEKKIWDPFMRMKGDMKAASDQVRRVMAELKGDEASLIALQKAATLLNTTRGNERVIARKAKKEKRDVRKEDTLVDKTISEIHDIEKYVSENKIAEAEKLLKNVIKQDAKVFKAVEDEIKLIINICVRAANLFVRLVKFLNETLPAEERRLESTGFPEEHLKIIKEKDGLLFDEINKHRADLYRLARFEDVTQRVA